MSWQRKSLAAPMRKTRASQSRLPSVGDGDLLSSLRSVCRRAPGAPPPGWHLVSTMLLLPLLRLRMEDREFLLLVGPCSSPRCAAPPAPLACRSPEACVLPGKESRSPTGTGHLPGAGTGMGTAASWERSLCLQGAHCPVQETVQFNSVWRVAGAADGG